ncbi:UDP-N-acetylmuramoyl-tripeptide--D-alanyl-D-alanine ligase [Leptospira ryugenii]|uniref:UDP-N-acetylmuramoyl-tripeptide--D-alanyl-D-alanine ligase n=1 Tax=Leptospira ryugenii TaxID=1917863 RepID=A0A2P2DX13_9LEPT|nr:UDP-N-acetylmuramoyl-tripeptide--D-alanyl-D-alanine ligase [Leptospira ryugenii]GBF49142.1 UDP-N-acetylmuramoyl-tripeptide--D-alanyl-D-alanine ligase [Leptospira ryugenii]
MISPFSYSLSTILTFLGKEPKDRIHAKGSVSWITNSSLEARPGALFVPLKDKRDGHEFISDALRRGAAYFLYETGNSEFQKLSKEEKSKGIAVQDALLALGQLAKFHRNRFSCLVIGITGSSGKTSTKELLGNLFHFLKPNEKVITEKNYNNHIGVPFTLFHINEKTKVVVCEMGMNHRGEISYLSKIAKPNIALITTIGSAHIENLGSPKAIALEKSDIVQGMDEGSVLFVPQGIQFPEIVKQVAKSRRVSVRFWPMDKNPILKVVKTNRFGFTLEYKGKEIQWNLPGKSLLSNVRGVVAVAEALGLADDTIIKGIQSYKSPDKRLLIKKSYFHIIDDSYNANPESMLSSIDASLQYAENQTIIWLLGSMKELGKFSKSYHLQIGKSLQNHSKHHLFTFGKDATWIGKAAGKVHKGHLEEDNVDFTQFALQLRTTFPKGTVILVKGSRSMKMERFVEALFKLESLDRERN